MEVRVGWGIEDMENISAQAGGLNIYRR